MLVGSLMLQSAWETSNTSKVLYTKNTGVKSQDKVAEQYAHQKSNLSEVAVSSQTPSKLSARG